MTPDALSALATLTAFSAPYPEAAEAVAALRYLLVPVPPEVTAALDVLWDYAGSDVAAQIAIVSVKVALGIQAT